ncbi:hypothetical protein Q8G71_37485, partial [Klebsiella pneumoniae]
RVLHYALKKLYSTSHKARKARSDIMYPYSFDSLPCELREYILVNDSKLFQRKQVKLAILANVSDINISYKKTPEQ